MPKLSQRPTPRAGSQPAWHGRSGLGKRDEPLDEIWAIRRRMAKQFDYDPKKAGEYFRCRQKAAGVKIYRRKEYRGLAKQA